MSDYQTLLNELSNELDGLEKDLIRQKKEALEFVDTEHKAKTTKERIKSVIKFETQIDNAILSLLDIKKTSEFKSTAEELCVRANRLYEHTARTNKLLKEDLAERGTGRDVVRDIGIFFGIVAAFVTIAKEKIGLNPALGLGGLVGIATLNAKKIMTMWSDASTDVCGKAKCTKDTSKQKMIVKKAACNVFRRAKLKQSKDMANRVKAGIKKARSNLKPSV